MDGATATVCRLCLRHRPSTAGREPATEREGLRGETDVVPVRPESARSASSGACIPVAAAAGQEHLPLVCAATRDGMIDDDVDTTVLSSSATSMLMSFR